MSAKIIRIFRANNAYKCFLLQVKKKKNLQKQFIFVPGKLFFQFLKMLQH